MSKGIKKIVFFILPLLLKYLFLFVFKGFDSFDSEDFHEDFVFCGIVFLLYYFVVGSKKYLANILLFVYVIYFILEGTSYLAMSTNFTSSYMYLLLESSTEELTEFYKSYLSFAIVFLMLLLLSSFFFLKKQVLNNTQLNKIVLGLVLSLGLVAFLKFTGLIESNAYHNIVRGVYGYYELQGHFKIDDSVKEEDVKLVTDNDVLVIVLGESTARGHMELYGYHRKTSPNLNLYKGSLYIYDDVISTDVFTLKAVPKMLTSITNNNNKNPKHSIIDVFNKSGFSTYWLSNQRPISYHDNAISAIASQSNYFKFYNHKIDKHTTILDEVMLPRYDEILSEPGKKVIVIRLIGTHFDYNKRYPVSFNKFGVTDGTKEEIIKSEYDNAVLYNDFIVYSILENLKNRNGNNALIYLSDHGENVYEEGDFFGRIESNLTKNMFDIPFLVWTSGSFELPKDFEFVPNRKFMTDHLYESIGHLFGVKHCDMDFSKSIFSNQFIERKRTVVTGIDYDEHFIKLTNE